jgi:LuxR family maltose regulon positive regulatory protein
VVRPRLCRELDWGSELPLTVVSAPAGYGKSTLVASWLETREGPWAWLSLDEGDGDAVLAWLQNSNLFVICLDDEKRWFRFHHLFRELLVHQLDKSGHSDQIRDIQHRAAAWLEKMGHYDQALSYLLEAKDTDSAVELIKRNRSTQMNREHWSQLDRWIHRLPSERIQREPEILLQQAWVYENRFRYPEMLGLLEKIETLFLEHPPSTELQGELDAIVSTRHYLQGDGERAAAFARCALHTLPEERLSERGYATVLLTLALQLVNRPDEARQVALEALEDRRHRGTSLHARCILALCFVHSMEGDMDSLLRSASELLALGQKYSLGESVSFARYFLGSAHWDRNDLEAAKSVLEPLAQERVPFQISTQAHAVYLLAKIRALQGQPREAQELLGALASGALDRQHTELIRLADFFAADVALQKGQRRQAMLWAERFEPNLEGPWWLSQLPELTWVQVLMASDKEEWACPGLVDRLSLSPPAS